MFTLIDYLKIFYLSFSIPKKQYKFPEYKNLELIRLFERSLVEETASLSLICAIAKVFFIRNLNKNKVLIKGVVDWNENQDTFKGHDIGVIAQEIESAFPELVKDREDGYKGVRYEKLVAVCIQAIKELKQEIDRLKDEY